MKALTIWQPWASLIAIGAKKIETRPWQTKYRGPIAIHASKHIEKRDALTNPIYSTLTAAGIDPHVTGNEGLILGAVIAIADLIACELMTAELISLVPEPERSFGWYEPGRYMWLLENVRLIKPVPTKGGQRIYLLLRGNQEIKRAGYKDGDMETG